MTTLQVGADSGWWLHAGAALILFLHIAGGTIALVAGAAALSFRKGSRRHALAGHAFFVSMIVMAAIGALVAPFLLSPQGDPKWFDSLAAWFTLYLVATGWMTVRRKAGTTGAFEKGALVFAAALAVAALLLGFEAAASHNGLLGGYGATGYHVFAGLLGLAAALDLNTVRRGGATGASRIARHVWRMCAALFIAAGAFFLGQQRVMPEAIQGSPWLIVPPLAVLALMLFWLVKLRVAKRINQWKRDRRRRRAAAAPAQAA